MDKCHDILEWESGQKVKDEEACYIVDGYPLDIDLNASISTFISRKEVNYDIQGEEDVDGYLYACKEDAPARSLSVAFYRIISKCQSVW